MHQNVEHFQPIFLAPAGGNGHAQHHLLAFIVDSGVELEPAAGPKAVLDGPTGEAAGHGDDIFLRVTAVHAERVQLEQLAGVILIQPPGGPGAAPHPGQRLGSWRRNRLPVIQVEQHGRILRRRQQHVLELAKNMRTNGIALVGRHQKAIIALFEEYVEMVVPEIDQHFIQLSVAVYRAQKLALAQIIGGNGLWRCVDQQLALQSRGCV